MAAKRQPEHEQWDKKELFLKYLLFVLFLQMNNWAGRMKKSMKLQHWKFHEVWNLLPPDLSLHGLLGSPRCPIGPRTKSSLMPLIVEELACVCQQCRRLWGSFYSEICSLFVATKKGRSHKTNLVKSAPRPHAGPLHRGLLRHHPLPLLLPSLFLILRSDPCPIRDSWSCH